MYEPLPLAVCRPSETLPDDFLLGNSGRPLTTRCGHSWSDNFSGIRYSVAVNNQGDKMTDKKSNESRRKLLKSITAGSGAVVVEIHATTA